MTRREYRVEFRSPGTFFHETTTKPIDKWDPAVAAKMAKDIVERYGAKPFGFVFHELLVADPVPDGEGGFLRVQPRIVRTSPMHFLGGTVIGYDDVPDTPENKILRDNMLSNIIPLVIVCQSPHKSTHPFHRDSRLLDPDTGEEQKFSEEFYVKHNAVLIRHWEERYGEESACPSET